MSALKLQTAIFTKLSSELSYNIYDNVPQDAKYPYIVIGDDTLVDFSTSSTQGFEATVTIHSWSDWDGRSEVKGIQDEIYSALHQQTLNVIGYNFIEGYQEFSETILEADGIVRHGVQRFRILFDK